jgi:hypothetical protein
MTTPSLSPRVFPIVLSSLLLVGLADGFYSYRLTQQQRNLEAVMNRHDRAIEALNQSLKDNYTDLQGEMHFTKERLGTTQVEIRKAQQSSAQLAKQQNTTAKKWTEQFDQIQQKQDTAQASIGNLSTDVEGVKSGLNSANQQLNSTHTDLQRVMGDLGVQSGLIARNHSEIDELRLLGERSYYEFDLGKTKQPQRVGNVAISLKKVDTKRQRYTLNLISDDRTIEKRDKTVDEPVQFYQAGFRQPSEIVVNQIKKDRIIGYLSVPKKGAEKSSLSEAEPPSSKPRS